MLTWVIWAVSLAVLGLIIANDQRYLSSIEVDPQSPEMNVYYTKWIILTVVMVASQFTSPGVCVVLVVSAIGLVEVYEFTTRWGRGQLASKEG
ncbi:MAG: hypothetical protein WC773_01905 [Patescibacteria group bacterium]|jgi:hypothetical protein